MITPLPTRSCYVFTRPLPLLLALAAVVVGVLLALRLVQPSPLAIDSGVLLDTPRIITPFTLYDQDEAVFDADRLAGRWTLIFPGFTHCPDICPATLGILAGVHAQLDADARERLQVVFFSVDPDRDTPQALKQYVTHFSPSFTAITGDKAEVDSLARSLAVAYRMQPLGDGAYTVDHSSALVLVSPAGHVAGFIQQPFSPQELAADLGRLIRSTETAERAS